MRGVSSCLFRRFTQGKSILFQEGAKVSGACRPNDFPGLLRTKVSLPLPRLSRACSSAHAGANSGGSWVEMGPGPKRAQTPCRRLHAGGQNAGHSPHALAKHPVTTGHLSVVQNPTFGPKLRGRFLSHSSSSFSGHRVAFGPTSCGFGN